LTHRIGASQAAEVATLRVGACHEEAHVGAGVCAIARWLPIDTIAITAAARDRLFIVGPPY
jgi:hypothetical protein